MYRPTARRWKIAPPDPAAAELAARLKTSPLLAQVLLNRGLREPPECVDFLRPSLKCLHEPALLPNLNKAAERVARAVRDRERIVIYGDYDVDGITATAILWHAIRTLGGHVAYYIPHRIEEGYGLNAEAMAQLCDEGAKLIISVDCGVTAVQEVRVACERGVDVIVTDHHEWKCQQGSGSGVQGSGEEGAVDGPSSAPPSSLNPEPRTLNPPSRTSTHDGPSRSRPRPARTRPPLPRPRSRRSRRRG